MHSWGKKGTGLETETLVRILTWIIFLVVAIAIIFSIFEGLTVRSVGTYGCFVANGVMSSNKAFRAFMEVPCKNEIIEDAMNNEEFAIYLADVWYMYGKGDWDFHSSDSFIVVSAFNLKEDYEIKDLLKYLLTHSGGINLAEDNIVTDKELERSDYNYLQEGSKGQTLCFDKTILDEQKMLGTQVYYLLFWDDVDKDDAGDKVVVSRSRRISKKDPVYCCSLKEGQCTKLDGEKWYEYHTAFKRFITEGDWLAPGAPKEESGKILK